MPVTGQGGGKEGDWKGDEEGGRQGYGESSAARAWAGAGVEIQENYLANCTRGVNIVK